MKIRQTIAIFEFSILAIILLLFLKKSNNYNFLLMTQAFKENGGAIYSVPREIIEMDMIRKHYLLQDFNLDESISNNPFLYQRAVEFLYPARIRIDSRHVFGTAHEKNNYRNCTEKSKTFKIVYHECEQ